MSHLLIIMRPIEVLYVLTSLLLAVYGFMPMVNTGLYWHYRASHAQSKNSSNNIASSGASPSEGKSTVGALSELPTVTVQLPIYNERHVAERLLAAVIAMNWPADRLQIQVLDDSTDDTTQMISAAIQRYSGTGIKIDHIHRIDRKGYKAGALEKGLVTAAGELIAIFDADFVPPANFLHEIIPMFQQDAKVGCVQARWGHMNPNSSQLTRAQALGIDGHFVVEQSVRAQLGAFLNFNGTAGVWRRACLEDAGGWQGDTLTEDLDLSYRAQLRGWRIAYRPDLTVPAELPVQIEAFKRQQFRWAKGSMQTAVKLMGQLWRAPQPVWRKLLGTIHLTNYAVHPLMLLNLLLLLPISFSHSLLLELMPLLTLAAVGPPMMYWTAMQAPNVPVLRRIRRLGVLMALGTGLSLSNTRAVLEAVGGVHSEFKRTPKFAVTDNFTLWQSSQYALPHNPIVWMELTLGVYAAGLFVYCVRYNIWWIAFWVLVYACGYSYIACLAFIQAWQVGRTHNAGAMPSQPVETLQAWDEQRFVHK